MSAGFEPVPLQELRNQVIDVERVFGAEAAELEGRLYDHLAQPEKQAGLLDKFLLGRLAPEYKTCLALHLAVQIAGSGGQTNLRLLSREIGYSPRHLDRIFQQCLGISPNYYRRIARFQKALQLLVADPGIELFVSDQEQAKAFYTNILGMELRTDAPLSPGSSARWIAVAPRGAKTEIILYLPDENWEHYLGTVGKSQALTLDVTDMANVHQDLKAKGVKFLQEPDPQPWGTYATIQDSEGNSLIIVEQPKS